MRTNRFGERHTRTSILFAFFLFFVSKLFGEAVPNPWNWEFAREPLYHDHLRAVWEPSEYAEAKRKFCPGCRRLFSGLYLFQFLPFLVHFQVIENDGDEETQYDLESARCAQDGFGISTEDTYQSNKQMVCDEVYGDKRCYPVSGHPHGLHNHIGPSLLGHDLEHGHESLKVTDNGSRNGTPG